MTTPAKNNLYIKGNDYFNSVWKIKNNGVAFDISAYDFRLMVKQKRGLNEPTVLSLSIGSGLTIVDGPNGYLRVTIEPQVDLTVTTTYVYDLVAYLDGHPYVWIEGNITFDPGVTYLVG